MCMCEIHANVHTAWYMYDMEKRVSKVGWNWIPFGA